MEQPEHPADPVVRIVQKSRSSSDKHFADYRKYSRMVNRSLPMRSFQFAIELTMAAGLRLEFEQDILHTDAAEQLLAELVDQKSRRIWLQKRLPLSEVPKAHIDYQIDGTGNWPEGFAGILIVLVLQSATAAVWLTAEPQAVVQVLVVESAVPLSLSVEEEARRLSVPQVSAAAVECASRHPLYHHPHPGLP